MQTVGRFVDPLLIDVLSLGSLVFAGLKFGSSKISNHVSGNALFLGVFANSDTLFSGTLGVRTTGFAIVDMYVAPEGWTVMSEAEYIFC